MKNRKRDRSPAREKLLDAAAELFYSAGVGATGIDAIIARAGVAKMSLYNNFASKAELVEAYMQRRLEEWRSLLGQRLQMAPDAREKAIAVFDSYVDHAHLAYNWGFRGCGLLNAAAELPVDDPARTVVAVQKEEVEELFFHFLSETGKHDSRKARETATHLSFLLEGAMARAGLEGTDARLKEARSIAISIIDFYLTGDGDSDRSAA